MTVLEGISYDRYPRVEYFIRYGIVPDQALVYETGNSAYILKAI